MQLDRTPSPSVSGLRSRLYSLDNELTGLLLQAVHPRARVMLFAARIDLRTAQMRLDARPDTIERENLATWFEMVAARLQLVSRSLALFGADAAPAQPAFNTAHAGNVRRAG